MNKFLFLKNLQWTIINDKCSGILYAKNWSVQYIFYNLKW